MCTVALYVWLEEEEEEKKNVQTARRLEMQQQQMLCKYAPQPQCASLSGKKSAFSSSNKLLPWQVN